jgi:hypothetical protein
MYGTHTARLWPFQLNAFSSFDRDSFMLHYFDILSHVEIYLKQNDTRDSDDGKTKGPRCAVS